MTQWGRWAVLISRSCVPATASHRNLLPRTLRHAHSQRGGPGMGYYLNLPTPARTITHLILRVTGPRCQQEAPVPGNLTLYDHSRCHLLQCRLQRVPQRGGSSWNSRPKAAQRPRPGLAACLGPSASQPHSFIPLCPGGQKSENPVSLN